MKILGRIKKSKVLTAVMTAVLIFQSACPTGLAYAAQKSGVSAYAAGQTIDQALGATKTVESVLSQHENDEYYLTTPYGNKGPHGEGGAIDTWDCWKPKGEYGSGAYMNCTGFVVAVLRACGANTSIIGNYTAKDGYNRGNETNAYKWDEYCRDNNAVSYTFSSKEQIRPRSGNPDNQPIASVPSVKGLTEHDRLAVCAKHLPLRHSLLSPAFALVGSIKAFECPSLRVLHAPLILPLEVQKLFLKICRFRSRIDQTVQQCQCPVPHRPVKRLLDGIPQKPHVLLLDFLLAHIHPFSSAVRTASPCHTSFVPRSRVRTRNGR